MNCYNYLFLIIKKSKQIKEDEEKNFFYFYQYWYIFDGWQFSSVSRLPSSPIYAGSSLDYKTKQKQNKTNNNNNNNNNKLNKIYIKKRPLFNSKVKHCCELISLNIPRN